MMLTEKGVGEKNLWYESYDCDHDLTRSRLTNA
jgi:hypothetical protein